MPSPRLLLASLFAAGTAFAGDYSKGIETPIIEESKWEVSSALDASHAYVGSARQDGQNVTEQSSNAQFVITTRYNQGIPVRLGVNWQRFSFGSTAGTRLPNTLQSINFVAGVDAQIFENIFLRLEAHPGWYSGSSDLLSRSFNVPVVFGGSYLVNKDLQFVLGVYFDAQLENYFLVGGGIRWQINDQWLANLVLPKPRLEFKASDQLTLYVGADLFEGTFRVDGGHGDRVGHRELNSAWVDYLEIRFGTGVTFKPTEKIAVDFEVGYMAYREAAFERADITSHTDGGGLYGGVAMRAKF